MRKQKNVKNLTFQLFASSNYCYYYYYVYYNLHFLPRNLFGTVVLIIDRPEVYSTERKHKFVRSGANSNISLYNLLFLIHFNFRSPLNNSSLQFTATITSTNIYIFIKELALGSFLLIPWLTTL